MSGKEFPWGTVTRVYKIGPHEITEYVSGPSWEDAGKTLFQAVNASFNTLEQAMIDCICHQQHPDDIHLPHYVFRLIGLPEG